jgi:hypothetical protein
MDVLHRACDGMAIAARNQLTVMAGVDPNPQKMSHRNFLTEDFAVGHLRDLADLDQNHLTADDYHPGIVATLTHSASIEEREGESRIVQPNPTLSTARH